MEKRQGILVAFFGLVILAAGGFWWFTQNAPITEAPAPVPAAAPAPATPPEPIVAAPAAAPESDAVALSEEAVDKILAEKNELASRAADLESQVSDGQSLIALQKKQIQELEAKLKQTQAGSPK